MKRYHCSAATFHYVSISKPNPVWFGKKSSNYWPTFPNQIQFGLENYCVKFGGKLIPNQIQFGLEKNAEHFSRQKSQTNSRLVWKYLFNYLKFFNISDICSNIKAMSCLPNRGQKVKSQIGSKCTWKRWKLFKVSDVKESESYLLLFIASSFNR